MAIGVQEIIRADMSLCQPAEALAWETRAGCWRLVRYETAEGLQGVMAFADPELGVPEITLPLNVSGPHQIFLGVNYTKARYHNDPGVAPWSPYGSIEVKLTDDLGFTRVAAETTPSKEQPGARKMGKGKMVARSIQEAYWKTADLTSQSLHIRLPIAPYDTEELRSIANLSYVRLVPLSADDVAFWQQIQPRDDTRVVGFLFCAGQLSGHIDGGPDFHPTDFDWFRHEMASIVHTDVGLLVLEVIRGHYCAFRTQVGDVGGDDNRWRDEWVDPLAAFTQIAHDHGIRIMVAMRMIGGAYPMTRYPIGWASFFWQHPEWVKRDRDGTPTTSLSLAFPGVQEHWLALLREALAYGIDGVTVLLHRFKPFVLYEEPTVASFKARYGEDPRNLPEDDPRWIRHGADYVTDFLRRVRRLVDEKPGRTLGVSFYGVPSKYDRIPNWEPLHYQCDVETWLREGIADYLFPIQRPAPSLVRRLSDLARGRAHIWPDLYPPAQYGEDVARLAQAYYDAGADGVLLNNAERQTQHISEWAVQRHLGHRELLDRLIAEAPSYYRRVPIKTLMGFATKYSFNNFGA